VGPDELGDHSAEPLPRVLLQEVACSFDDGMLESRRAGHAFLQVDRPSYRPEAAVDAWQRIWDFFGRYL